MGSKLQKNAIIVGYVNAYCVICDCQLDTMKEIKDHVQEDTHSDKLLAHPYLEKYSDNHIRKINKGYFCEFCSLILPTAAKMTLHVQERTHYEKKGTSLLRRPNGTSSVIAFDNILINEKAWHSLGDGTCAICDEEFDNEKIHKSEPGHLLKLVQSKIEFSDGNNVYRKIDNSSFHCITCNSVFRLNILSNHFNDSEHIKSYKKCQDEMKKYNEEKPENSTPKTAKTDAKDKKNGKKTTETKSVDKNHNNIEKNNSTPKLVAKPETVTVTKSEPATVTKPVTKPEKTNDCQEIALTSAKIEDEASIYANENNLTYNTGNTNAFCRICETKLPATLRSMKEHVNGKEHKNRLGRVNHAAQAKTTKQVITKRLMNKFIEYAVNVENIFHQDVVINEKYCLPLASFLMITKNGAKYRCQVCEINMYSDDIGEHTDTSRHERAMRDTPVITSLPDTEFVREVRTGIYHCGYCNLIVPRWEEVDSHLQSREHKENKDASTWRLQRHLPDIIQHRRQQEFDIFRLMMMGQMFRH